MFGLKQCVRGPSSWKITSIASSLQMAFVLDVMIDTELKNLSSDVLHELYILNDCPIAVGVGDV
jgi:hypothetical protein